MKRNLYLDLICTPFFTECPVKGRYIIFWGRGLSINLYNTMLIVSHVCLLYNVNDTLRMYKNDDIRMYNFNCITDTIVEVITTCNTYTLLTVHLL